MKTFFTSDNHFGHKNIITYCNRPFLSVEEMDKIMIENWNATVSSDDVVYHLGDFTLYGFDTFQSYCQKLNGRIYIVPGGHDKRWIKGWKKQNSDSSILSRTKTDYCFLSEPLISIKFNTQIIVVCHYAMRVWDRSHYGSLHLYGHSHGKLPEYDNSFDVGVDVNNYKPVSLDELRYKKRRRYEDKC